MKKVKYKRTIGKMSNEVLQRHNLFIEPMRKWLKCPDEKYRDNAISLFSQFLGEVDCLADQCNQGHRSIE